MAKMLYMVLYQEASFQSFSHLNFYLLVYSLIQTDQKDKVDQAPSGAHIGVEETQQSVSALKNKTIINGSKCSTRSSCT